jgi:hypothetical protein
MALLNVGMPGVGLGGIFYVVAALAMPFVESGRALRARLTGAPRHHASRRWGLVLRQAALAVGVLGGAWAMGLAIVRLQHATPARPIAEVATAGARAPLHIGTLALGLVLLTLVLGVVEAMRFVVRPRRAHAEAGNEAPTLGDEPLREVA